MADTPKQPNYVKMHGNGIGIDGTRPPIVKDGLRAHWKIHLNLSRDANDPTSKRLLEWANDNRDMLEAAKLGVDSAQAGKGMTIYAGSYDNMMKIAAALEELERKGEIKLPNPGREAVTEDMPAGKSGKIFARFDVIEQGTDGNSKFSPARYSRFGITVMNDKGVSDRYGGNLAREDKLKTDLKNGKLTQEQYDEAYRDNIKVSSARLTAIFGENFTGADPKALWINVGMTRPEGYDAAL
ncbi:MAG: hypothetical protein K2Q01_07205, partial [Rickettsiales bacterium]|nr:hypothetical protein [Rickettsiales bacterium]